MSGPILRFTVVISLAVGGFAIHAADSEAPRCRTPAPLNGIVRVETVAGGLEHPWGLARRNAVCHL